MTKPAPKVQESTPAVSIRPDSVHSAAPNPFPFGHRSHRAWEQLPQDVREVLSYLALEQRAEILELDSLFQEKFAERASLDLLERYCLERFDLLASQLLSVAIQPGPSSFNTQYENYLDTLQQAGQNNVGTVLKAMRSDVRDEVISRISLKLSSRKSHWLREEINWRLRGCPARPPLKTSLLEGDPGVGSGASSSLDVFVREFADLSDGTGEKIADLTAADLTPKETRGSEPMGVASTVARNVATKQDATAAPGNVRAAKPQASRWEDIDIVFLSEFMVQIGVNSQLEPPQNYAEMGFENKKNKKSNAAWVMLWELAQNGGVYRIAADSRKWSQIEKRMQEIRKAFRCRFALQDDPIPFLKKTPQNPEDFGYRAKFRIRCHPASDA